MTVRARLAWRCRRGMKELDLLLEGYLLEDYARASREEQAAFAELLERPDLELLDFCYGRSAPEVPAQARVIDRIRTARARAAC